MGLVALLQNIWIYYRLVLEINIGKDKAAFRVGACNGCKNSNRLLTCRASCCGLALTLEVYVNAAYNKVYKMKAVIF